MPTHGNRLRRLRRFPDRRLPPILADVLITRLQNNGYRVILDKVGAAPPDQCKVTSVTPGQQVITAGQYKVQSGTLVSTAVASSDPAQPKVRQE